MTKKDSCSGFLNFIGHRVKNNQSSRAVPQGQQQNIPHSSFTCSGMLLGLPDSINVVSAAIFHSNHTWCSCLKNLSLFENLAVHAQSLAPHGQNVAAHAQSLAPHAQNVAAHAQSLAPHAQNVAAQAQSLAPHAQNLAAHDQSLAVHAQNLAAHAQIPTWSRNCQVVCSGQHCAGQPKILQ